LKNFNMANRGQVFEEEVILTNKQYKRKGLANIQKISTPVKILKTTGNRVTGILDKKSTLDFRGTVKPKIPISFDCKETKDERGLPLKNIADHQIDYIKLSLEVGEVSFILCYMTKSDKRYYISGQNVICYWDRWKANKGKRGYNFIPLEVMKEIKSRNGILLDYLDAIKDYE